VSKIKEWLLDRQLNGDDGTGYEESMSWQDIANLTHATQVEKFNWCACEEQEQFPYDDCPKEGEGEQ
jgi:hypothetical protein